MPARDRMRLASLLEQSGRIVVAAIFSYGIPFLSFLGLAGVVAYLPAPFKRFAIEVLVLAAAVSYTYGAGRKSGDTECAAREAARRSTALTAVVVEKTRQANATATLARGDAIRDAMIRAGAQMADSLLERQEANEPTKVTPVKLEGKSNVQTAPSTPCRDRVDRRFQRELQKLRAAGRVRAPRDTGAGSVLP